MSLLEVTDLRVSFPTSDGVVRAVRGVSLRVAAGRTLGIVGESGSGKTVLTQTLLGLTPGAEVSGHAVFGGVDLIGLGDRELRDIRGAEIAVIFQDPLTSVHPLYPVGWQIAEMIRAHDKSVTKSRGYERAVELLARVGIPQPRQRVHDYPHQFSGGMRQRAMIAMWRRAQRPRERDRMTDTFGNTPESVVTSLPSPADGSDDDVLATSHATSTATPAAP